MLSPGEWFYSVADVWALWLVSTGLVAWLTAQVARQAGRYGLRRLLRSQRGASYSVSYVLAFPMYLMLVCLMVQSSLILLVKMGTVYAAYAAARAAIVWRSAEPFAASSFTGHMQAEEKGQMAAVFALTPFASSDPQHRARLYGGSGTSTSPMAEHYYRAYRQMADENVASDGSGTSPMIDWPGRRGGQQYVTAKYEFAQRATRVTLVDPRNQWNATFYVQVRYRMPLVIPGAGRILGRLHPGGVFIRDIESRAALPAETPDSDNQRLGIRYASGI